MLYPQFHSRSSDLMYPKLVALDTDWTIFSGSLDKNVWGKGPGASHELPDNIQRVNDWLLKDMSNPDIHIRLNRHIPNIVSDILKEGASLAIVSRNTSKALCDRALHCFRAIDPKTGKPGPIIDMVSYDEVVDESKTEHFKRIRGWSGFQYTDMILFDDKPENDVVETELGVTIQMCGGQKGLTWDIYCRGIEMWVRNKKIMSPYLGQNLSSYPRRELIRYAVLDDASLRLLERGKTHKKEPGRWGYGLYLTDDPAIAKFLRDRAQSGNTRMQVCAVWVRDAQLFDVVAKIWVPEDSNMMTNSRGLNDTSISSTQEQRNQRIDSYGIQKPYTLFSKHQYISGMPAQPGTRWNEMVLYPQVQDALFLVCRMSDKEVQDAIQNQKITSFNELIPKWDITVPEDTLEDFRAHGEISPARRLDSTQLRIAHFNDVYQVSDQEIQADNKQEKINVTKFATLLDDVRDKWKDGGKDGLVLFSGDLFSPSIESSTTRGGHMPPIINALHVDAAVAGNHEFDFGYPQLSKLIKDTSFVCSYSEMSCTLMIRFPALAAQQYHREWHWHSKSSGALTGIPCTREGWGPHWLHQLG